MPKFTSRISAALVVLVFSASRCSDSASGGGKYDAVVASLRSIEAKYPTITNVITIGKNDDNDSIIALRISPSPQSLDTGRVGHLVVGTQHGDEGAAGSLAVLFAEKLAAKVANGTLTPAPLLSAEWTIIPVVNLSGFEAGTREENGIDPNRDYPGPCTSDPGNRLASQRRIRELFDIRTFAGVISLHGFVGSFTYPWGVNTNQPDTADNTTYVTAANAAVALNGYQTGTTLQVVYAADGTFDDWAYWAHGSYTALIELESEADADLNRTADAMLAYFGELPTTPSASHAFTGSCLGRRGPTRLE